MWAVIRRGLFSQAMKKKIYELNEVRLLLGNI